MLDLLAPQSRIDPAVLASDGAFAWWYLDLVDEKGDGLVLIWSFALPFLPGEGPSAEQPSLALSVYRDGQVDFVLLTELDKGEFTEAGWRMGRSTFEQESRDGVRHLLAKLDIDTPKGPVTGTIRVQGPERAAPQGASDGADAVHGWSPQMGIGQAQATLRCADWSVSLEGECYRDRNFCTRPLDQLGITRWVWGRAAVNGALLIWYLVEGEHPSSRVFLEREGALAEVPVQVEYSAWRRDRYGLRWAERVHILGEGVDLRVSQGAPLDHGPFYLRHPVQAVLNGQSGRGWGELVVPDKLDRPWMRPFVNMRTQRLSGNSMWLPLFAGPRPLLRWL